MGFRTRAHLGAVVLLVVFISVAYCALDTCTRFRLPLDPFFAIAQDTQDLEKIGGGRIAGESVENDRERRRVAP